MIDPISFYAGLKFWLPMFSAFALVIKAYSSGKKNISEWADKLLNNHLSHIETATTLTHSETVKTNTLLTSAALADVSLRQTVDSHNAKQEQVWAGVLNTLTVLEDRTRTSRTPRTRKARKR